MSNNYYLVAAVGWTKSDPKNGKVTVTEEEIQKSQKFHMTIQQLEHVLKNNKMFRFRLVNNAVEDTGDIQQLRKLFNEQDKIETKLGFRNGHDSEDVGIKLEPDVTVELITKGKHQNLFQPKKLVENQTCLKLGCRYNQKKMCQHGDAMFCANRIPDEGDFLSEPEEKIPGLFRSETDQMEQLGPDNFVKGEK